MLEYCFPIWRSLYSIVKRPPRRACSLLGKLRSSYDWLDQPSLFASLLRWEVGSYIWHKKTLWPCWWETDPNETAGRNWATNSPEDTMWEKGFCPPGGHCPIFPHKQIAASIDVLMHLFSAPWVGPKLENICTSFIWVWFIRTPRGSLSPFSSSSLGLGGFVFFFKQACVSWDWVTLIYYALDSLTKDSGTGHLFSEW